jgi:hypothetical protein
MSAFGGNSRHQRAAIRCPLLTRKRSRRSKFAALQARLNLHDVVEFGAQPERSHEATGVPRFSLPHCGRHASFGAKLAAAADPFYHFVCDRLGHFLEAVRDVQWDLG